MWKVVVILGAAACASATVGPMGSCNTNIVGEKIDFNEFSTTNGGVWYFKKSTDTPNYSKFKSLKSVSTPTKTKGAFDVVIYFEDHAGKSGVVANETHYASDGFEYNIKGKNEDYSLLGKFLKYKPGVYAYYYICKEAGDDNLDHRAVVATRDLTKEEIAEIEAFDKSQHFKGKLVDIGQKHSA